MTPASRRPSGTATIVDTIGAPPAPPVANNVSTQTLEGTALTLNVLAGASDPSGYTLSLASFTQPGHGTVAENSNASLTYTPAAGYLGADSFTYTVSDGHGETATGTVSITVVAPATASNWPAHVFAPYVDMTLYPTYNLVTAMQTAGLKYFTLAFIVADSNNAPAWGGYSTYEVNGGTFDQSIRTEISQVRQLGGDVSVSFGGENGQELAQAITSVSALTAAYQQVITAYGLTHIDFDIEGRRGRRPRLDRPPLAGDRRAAADRRGGRQDARRLVHPARAPHGPDRQRPLRAPVGAEVRREDLAPSTSWRWTTATARRPTRRARWAPTPSTRPRASTRSSAASTARRCPAASSRR